jgi:hypothetical protein
MRRLRNSSRWEGWEEHLGNGVFATWLKVVTWWSLDQGLYAQGVITFESVPLGSKPIDVFFHATTTDSYTWSVRETGPEDCGEGMVGWFETPDVYPFTDHAGTNHAIKRFIAQRLTEFIQNGCHENVAPSTKPREGFETDCPCQCRVIELGNDLRLIFHNIGLRCFLCSCGQRWWEQMPFGPWLHVSSERAWRMLITHKGCPVQPIYQQPDGIILLREHLVEHPPEKRVAIYANTSQRRGRPDR